MLQDYKLGLRMLLKCPGLTIAGGLALAIAIGLGAGWYDLWGKILWPSIPLPEGERLVLIETHNALTNEPEPRVAHDFLEWRRGLRTIETLGAYRTDNRNLIAGNAAPQPIQIAELTAAAFRIARVPPLLGRVLLDSDEAQGAPNVVVLGYDVWQRRFGGRPDVVGSIVKLGNAATTVIGIMPDGFTYPTNHDAWTPLRLRPSYAALDGGPIAVIGKLAPGVTQDAANAEVRVLGERAAAALPATHEHLRPQVFRLGEIQDVPDIAQFALTNLPGLLLLMIACLTVGTLIYARTATREAEIAIRSALGASRARIVGQLFGETLVLASLAAIAGLVAADRTLAWGIELASRNGAPFWITPGLRLTTILYAGGLAIVSAALLSLLPALKATNARVQSRLANLGAGGATLRFGRVWTTAMIAQVALTAMGIPAAMEGANQALRGMKSRATFPSQNYLSARIEMNRTSDEEATAAVEERRARTFAALERRVAQEPGVVSITFADRAPGSVPPRSRTASVETSPGAGQPFDIEFKTSAVGAEFFETFERPILSGRAFNASDESAEARTVIVNEAFARIFLQHGGSGSPVGTRLRYSDQGAASASEPSFEIVGIVRDIGLDPDEEGNESSYVFFPASAGSISRLVMSVRMRINPAALVARLPFLAGNVDADMYLDDARPLDETVWQRNLNMIWPAAAGAAVTSLVLFLSMMGIFSLMSVNVSRRTREIGVRAALGANPRHVLAGILSHAAVLMGSGIAVGGALLLLGVAFLGPSGRPADDVAQFAVYLALTSALMIAACLLACIEPARRALRINPIEALREG